MQLRARRSPGSRFRSRGAGAAEYSLLVGVVALAAIGTVASSGNAMKDAYCSVTDSFFSAGALVDCGEPIPLFAVPDAEGMDPSEVTTVGPILPERQLSPELLEAGTGLKVSPNGETWNDGFELDPGESFFLRASAPETYATTISYALALGPAEGSWQITTRDPDLRPDPLAEITPVADADRTSWVESGWFDVSGVDLPVPVAIEPAGSGEYRIDDGAGPGPWLDAGGNVAAGDWLQARLFTPDSVEPATARTNVRVGSGEEAEMTALVVTTGDYVPDPVAFQAVDGVEPNAVTLSEEVSLTGFTKAVEARVADGLLRVDGGDPVASAVVAPGARIALESTAPATPATDAEVELMLDGQHAATWSISTRAADIVPDPFAIAPVTDAGCDSEAISEPITPAGYLDPTSISVAGEGNPEISIDGGAWTTTDTIAPGESFQVRLTSGAPSEDRVAEVSVGGVVAPFSATCMPAICASDPGTVKLTQHNWGRSGKNKQYPVQTTTFEVEHRMKVRVAVSASSSPTYHFKQGYYVLSGPGFSNKRDTAPCYSDGTCFHRWHKSHNNGNWANYNLNPGTYTLHSGYRKRGTSGSNHNRISVGVSITYMGCY